jgi:hypothetical protein
MAERESDAQHDRLLEEVKGGVADISGRHKRFTVRAEHQVADFLIVCLGQDVVDNIRGMLVLLEAEIPRAAAASVRGAYEGAQDMLLLATMGAEYDLAGATAYAAELQEQQELRSRLMAGGNALGAELTDAGRRTAAEVVADEVARLNREVPGLGDLLREAARAVAEKPGKYKKHWSTLQRREIALEIEKRCTNLGAIGLGAEALYGQLSVQTHPRFRTLERRLVREDDGPLTIVMRAIDTSLLRLALLALQLSDEALTRAEAIRT